MKVTPRTILILLVVLTLLFIWGNSILPADLSSVESRWVQHLLTPFLEFMKSGRIQAFLTRIAGQLPERISSLAYRGIELLDRHILSQDASFLVRKAAHFTEYMLLGLFSGLLLASSDGRSRFLISEAVCIAVAVIDESIQLFSNGRSSQFRDVIIDASGSMLGLIFVLIILAIMRLCQPSPKPPDDDSKAYTGKHLQAPE